MSYYSELPVDLLNEIEAKNCVLFVGSGISRKCLAKGRRPLPNWHEFLYSFLKWMNRKKSYERTYYEELKRLINEEKLLVVAEEILENTETSDFTAFLRESFDSKNIVPSFLHKLIPIIPFRGIITINYDNLIELSYIETYKRIPKIFVNTDMIDGSLLDEQEFYILKMHGDIENPRSIVLSYKTYVEMMYKSPSYRDLLEKLFTEHCILFIGYGGRDPNVESIIDKLSTQTRANTHYMLAQEGSLTEIEKKRFKVDRNIHVIEYVDYFGLHNHLDSFFEDILSILIKKHVVPDDRPHKLRTRINVYYNDHDQKDGEFLWYYFFREGAITLSEEAQKEQSNIFLNKFDEVSPIIDFLVFFLGDLESAEGNKFLQRVDQVLSHQDRYTFEVIIVSLNKNRKWVKAKYMAEKTFFVKNDFIDIDLKNVKEYISNQIQ